jgi:hypothetical protein
VSGRRARRAALDQQPSTAPSMSGSPRAWTGRACPSVRAVSCAGPVWTAAPRSARRPATPPTSARADPPRGLPPPLQSPPAKPLERPWRGWSDGGVPRSSRRSFVASEPRQGGRRAHRSVVRGPGGVAGARPRACRSKVKSVRCPGKGTTPGALLHRPLPGGRLAPGPPPHGDGGGHGRTLPV